MNIIEKTWSGWKIKEEIGRGSYGTVYKCFKEEKGNTEHAAVKVISIPQGDYSEDAEKMSSEEKRLYYKDIADELVKEFEILKELKGTKNIVEIYDAEVVQKEDGVGWYILIRMELLTAFNIYSKNRKFTEAEVIKLGLDLSSALSVCHKAKIVHRDIKPENIFVDDEGNFKLGDFGVAKQMEKTQGSMSIKGTYSYMSPEVLGGKRSDGRADMYSLALVMYKLLNNDRLPFLDPNKVIIRYNERQAAFERRIKGEDLPEIPGVSKEINAVILKACAFKNIDRQKNIDEFSDQLVKILKGQKIRKNPKKSTVKKACSVMLAVALLAVSGAFAYAYLEMGLFDKVEISSEKPEVISLRANENGITEDSIDNKYLYKDESGIYLYDKAADKTVLISEESSSGAAFDGEKVVYTKSAEEGLDGASENKCTFVFYNIDTGEVETKNVSEREGVKNVDIIYFDDKFALCKAETETGEWKLWAYNMVNNSLVRQSDLKSDTVLSYKNNAFYATDRTDATKVSSARIFHVDKASNSAESKILFDEKAVFCKNDYLYFLACPTSGKIKLNRYAINSNEKPETVCVIDVETEKLIDGTVTVMAMNDKYICLKDGEEYLLWSNAERKMKSITIKEKHGELAEFFVEPELTDRIVVSFRNEASYDYCEILKNGSFRFINSIAFDEEADAVGDTVYSVIEAEEKALKVYDMLDKQN